MEQEILLLVNQRQQLRQFEARQRRQTIVIGAVDRPFCGKETHGHLTGSAKSGYDFIVPYAARSASGVGVVWVTREASRGNMRSVSSEWPLSSRTMSSNCTMRPSSPSSSASLCVARSRRGPVRGQMASSISRFVLATATGRGMVTGSPPRATILLARNWACNCSSATSVRKNWASWGRKAPSLWPA